MIRETTKIGKEGIFIIPINLRNRYGLKEGSLVIAEEHEDGVLIKPTTEIPVERYTLERKAEFYLSNAVDEDDYAQAVDEVRAMGLDPNQIPHAKIF